MSSSSREARLRTRKARIETRAERIVIMPVGRQKEQLGACRANGAAHGFPLVTSEIVHDDNVAGLERWHQYLLDIGEEGLPIDRAVDDARRVDSIAAERGQKSERLPVAMRNLRHQPYAARAAPMSARHIGLGPGLIDENHARRIQLVLVLLPSRAPPGDVRTILLAGAQAFF